MKDFNSKDGKRPSASFVVGAVALLFLIVGYQAALFIHKAAVARVIANNDEPDTVFVYEPVMEEDSTTEEPTQSLRQAQRPNIWQSQRETQRPDTRQTQRPDTRQSHRQDTQRSLSLRGTELVEVSKRPQRQQRSADSYKSTGRKTEYYRKESVHSPAAEEMRRNNTGRKYESFRFNPNTVSIDDLMRLGFTQRQAQSIDNYRQKGGRFRKKSDFAKSYVVEDSVFRRLEKYIDIPKIDINSADSVTFMTLPGIGKFFAGKMVSYRGELGGYSYPEQLMDIWHFDQEKFDNLKDLIRVDTTGTPAYSLWTLPEKELAAHPYIGRRAARSIVMFRDNSPKEDWTVANLAKAGILDPEKATKLAKCRIARP